MTTAVVPTGSPTGPPPRRYVVPSVQGDPGAARRLASTYRDLAAEVSSTGRQLAVVVRELDGGWVGRGSSSALGPVDAVMRDIAAVATALEDAAGRLDAYARTLAAARERHGFSLHKLLAVGAIVAVAGAALVVTVGAASVVEAAAATAAVEGATEAAGLATAADAAAADGLLGTLRSLTSLRPLLQFVLPHLLQVEWSSATVGAYGELTEDQMNWRSMGLAAGVAVVGSGTAAQLTERIESAGWLADAPPAVRAATPHVIQGGFWGGVDATDELVTSHGVHPLDVLETAGIAGGGSSLHMALQERGILFHEIDYRRAALVDGAHLPGRLTDPELAHEMALIRQPVEELLGGRVDLRLQEGPGHTLNRHVSRSGQWLLERTRTERRRFASSFWDEPTAQRATSSALAAVDKQQLSAWLASKDPRPFVARHAFPDNVGVVIDRRGLARFARNVVVLVQRDSYGQFVLTSYVELPH